MTVTVRRSTRHDARAISAIRVETWRTAYRGLIDDAVLDRLDIDSETARRAQHWDEHHVDPRGAEFIAEIEGEAVGWAVTGAPRHPEDPRTGELYAMYVLPQHWSRGIGHALMDAAEQALRHAGFRTAHLWVLDGNERAAAFYQRRGWVEDGATKTDDRLVGDTRAAGIHERRRVRDLADQAPGRSRMPNA
jgi:GNAT superfamily N-acetyltransferase